MCSSTLLAAPTHSALCACRLIIRSMSLVSCLDLGGLYWFSSPPHPTLALRSRRRLRLLCDESSNDMQFGALIKPGAASRVALESVCLAGRRVSLRRLLSTQCIKDARYARLDRSPYSGMHPARGPQVRRAPPKTRPGVRAEPERLVRTQFDFGIYRSLDGRPQAQDR